MKNLILLSLILVGQVSLGQDRPDPVKDDPHARYEFELMRLKNPRTGKIPKNIRTKELQFADRMASQMRQSGVPASSWSNRGPYNVGGRTRALAVDVRDEDVILAGGVSGGLWKSTDQGASWSKTTSTLDLQSITAIAQDTRTGQEDTWYYATGEFRGNSARGFGAPYSGSGIFKSTDGGNSWSLLAATSDDTPQDDSDDFDYNHEIAVNPVNGDVYVANVGGIYRSQNGGTSWTQVLDGSISDWSDVVISSTGVIYATTDVGGVFSSATGNSGEWTNISSGSGISSAAGDRLELAISSNDEVLYMLGENGSSHQLWVYDEVLDSWTDRSANIPALGGLTGNFTSQGGYDLLIKVRPGDENFVVIGGTNLFKSTDGFATSFNAPSSNNPNWIGGYTASNGSYALYPNHHPDQHAFVFLSGTKALSGNDGGVQLTDDFTASSVSWNWMNNGYLTSQSYAISIGPGDQILSGFQDNSTWLTTSTDPEFTWTDQFGGDGAYSAINSDGTVRFMSSQNANINRVTYPDANSHSASGYFGFDPASGYETLLFITPFYLDPLNDDLFYLAGDYVFFVNTQANTGGSSTGWKSIPTSNSGVFTEIGVTNFNQVLVGTHIGELFRITDPGGAATSEEISGTNFPSAYISGIAVNPFNQNDILVCFSNYEVQSVFHTSDGGDTWTHVSGNLEENENGTGNGPSARMVAIVGNGDRYFVGTSTGLYSTDVINGSSTTWTREDEAGIGNVVVEHIASREDGLIVVGTHANGMYSSNITINNVNDVDLSVTNLTPNSGVLGDENVVATVFNSGSVTQTSYDLSLFVDDQLVVTETVNLSVASLQSVDYTFIQSFDFSSPGEYTVRVEVDATNDGNTGNDSFEKTIESINVLNSFPYAESFEDDNHGWTADGVWELGNPSTLNVNGTTDGVRAWATDLDSDYPDSHTAYLESPFFDLSSMTNPTVSFDINYSIEANWDGVVFGYRTDATSAYEVLFDLGGFENWYPGNANVFGHDAWQGNTGGSYVTATASLASLASNTGIQFAFIFKSDVEVTDEGFAMDNFLISESGAPPTDISLSNSTIVENEPIGTSIGTLSTTDLDDSEHDYSFDSEVASDNSSFSLVDDEVFSAEVFDFETKTSYTINIQTTDSKGNSLSKILSVSVTNDVGDDPLGANGMEQYGVKVHPNPVKGRLNMNMINDYFGDVFVRVYTIEGKRTVVENTVRKDGYSVNGLIDLNTLPRGLYIVEFTMGDKILRGKVIKE